MRKTLLLCMALAALTMTARQRTTAELTAEAQHIFATTPVLHSARITAQGMALAPAQLSIMSQGEQTTVVGYANGGYVLLANNDEMPALLAYSTDNYSTAIANPSLTDFLSTMEGYLAYCEAKGEEPAFIQHRAVTYNPLGVEPICVTHWSQSWPYYNQTPFYETSRTLTGCVATAMAQALYTLHRQEGTEITLRGYKQYAYQDSGKKRALESLNFSGITLNWNNMLMSYSGTATYVQQKAVAQLMHACGVATSMNYGVDGSGAYCNTAAMGINNHMKGVHSIYYDGITAIYQDIYNELDAGRVMMYSGATSENSGHAFIIDGYDSDGLVHINLGWGGGDTYTKLADMNGYSNYQTLNYFRPSEEGELRFSTDEPLDELKGKYAFIDIEHPAEAIDTMKWYVLYNIGRMNAIYSQGVGKKILNTSYIPTGESTDVAAPMLVRFIKQTPTSSLFYIQTGTGDYFGALAHAGNNGTTATAKTKYTAGNIQKSKTHKYFYFKQSGNSSDAIMDCNNEGGGLAGWGLTTPSDTLANASWQIFPVEICDSPDSSADKTFDTTHTFKLLHAATGYYFRMSSTVTLTKTSYTTLRFEPAPGGWWIKDDASPEKVLSVRTNGSELGTNTIASNVPEIYHFAPTGNPNEYRIYSECGYLATQNTASGTKVYGNMAPTADYGVWQVIDITKEEEEAAGISTVSTTSSMFEGIHDIQGRSYNADTTLPHGIYIINGKKVLR